MKGRTIITNDADGEPAGPMFNPPHLGELIRESMDEVGWSVNEMASRLGCERGALSRLLNGKAGVSASMALALEALGWGEADHWTRMQASYELVQARRACRRHMCRTLTDGGIDGRIPLLEKKQAIVSMKSGHVDVRMVRELNGLLNDKAVAGVSVTKEAPTKPMRDFVAQAGICELEPEEFLPIEPFPRLQILTLDEILWGRLPELPYVT